MRSEITVDGIPISFLSAGEGPLVLLLHGTYWSRVWAPVMPAIAKHGVRAVAVDFPGAGRSGGRAHARDGHGAGARHVGRALRGRTGRGRRAAVAGHDIGGAVTQHLAAHGRRTVPRFALVNSVTYDSWPVDGVKRFRDPEVAAAVTVEELLEWRRKALYVASAACPRSASRPTTSPRGATRRRRSRGSPSPAPPTPSTREQLVQSPVPKLLVWGEDDPFQPITYAEIFAANEPNTELIRIPNAGHIPMENDHRAVGDALGRFFSSRSPS